MRAGANVMHFARLLRRAGLPVGPADAIAAQRALAAIDIGERAQARAALRATMVRRHEHDEIFDQAFACSGATRRLRCRRRRWRCSRAPRSRSRRPAPAPDASPRPWRRPAPARRRRRTSPPQIDAVMTTSEREQLQTMDFEQMSAAQVRAAKAEMRRLALPLDARRTRRFRPTTRGPAPTCAPRCAPACGTAGR